MKSLVKHLQDVNAQHNLWQREDVVVVGVSGGPDSMCLLDVLVKIARKDDLKIIVAHVNYGLRGMESDADHDLVKKTAQQHGLSFEALRWMRKEVGSEALWRRVRYDFFEKTRKKYNATHIAVGHTKDDQAETILLQLFRGAGLRGVRGMRYKNHAHIIRPLLAVSRTDVLAYCKKNEIRFRIDRSNEEEIYRRNTVRAQIMPLLCDIFGAKIVDVVARFGMSAADDHAFIASTIPHFWQKDHDNMITFSAAEFKSLHIAQQRMALFLMIESVRGSVDEIEKGFMDEIRKALFSTKGKNQMIEGKDLKMHRKGDRVELACLSGKKKI